MDKLEQYIDQVCKSIGGPHELRQHVRQELREHLLDAVAQHKAAGMTEADAVSKALEEFGKPEEVRAELEAAHGKRTAWLIDKVLEWKEKTMRSKWLWATWASLGLATVIGLELFFLWLMVAFIVPRFQTLLRFGLIDSGQLNEKAASTWMEPFLDDLAGVNDISAWWLIVPALAWVLFEWRLHSENKTMMRLAAFGTIAVGLMIVVTLTALALIIPPCLTIPDLGRTGRPGAIKEVEALNNTMAQIEDAPWVEVPKILERAKESVQNLLKGPTTFALTTPGSASADDLRRSLKLANLDLWEMHGIIGDRDTKRFKQALEKFNNSIEPVRQAAGRPQVWLIRPNAAEAK